jgi:hypothetical protein
MVLAAADDMELYRSHRSQRNDGRECMPSTLHGYDDWSAILDNCDSTVRGSKIYADDSAFRRMYLILPSRSFTSASF